MFRYREGDLSSLLFQAFKCEEGSIAPPSFELSRSGRSSEGRLIRDMNKAAGALIIRFIDREMSPEERAVFRCIYAGEITWDSYIASVNSVIKRNYRSCEMNSVEMTMQLGRLATLVPYEVRYSVRGEKKKLQKQDNLATMMGVGRKVYRNHYQVPWKNMLRGLHEVIHDREAQLLELVEDNYRYEESA